MPRKPPPQPGLGQDALLHVERERHTHLAEGQNVFSTAATPGYWSLEIEEYSDITGAMIEAAAARKLRPALIDVEPGDSRLIAGYQPPNGLPWRRIPLYPFEYRVLARTTDPGRYGEVVVAASLSGKRALQTDVDAQQTRIEADRLDAIGKKKLAISGYLKDGLEPTHGKLVRILEAAEHPGLRRRKEIDARVAIGDVLFYILPQVVQVIGRQRQWTAEQHVMARKAIEARLFFTREDNQHLQNWVDLLKLLRDYNQEKINLFRDREEQFGGYLAHYDRIV